MFQQELVLELIERIYAAVDLRALWLPFLEALGIVMSAPAVALHAEDLSARHGEVNAAIGLDPTYQQSYATYYGGTNPWLLRGHHLFSEGKVVTGEMVLEESEFARTEYLADWLKPQGYHYGLGSIVLKRGAHLSFLSALRPKGSGPFDTHVVSLMTALMPHLQRAFQLARRIDAAEAHALSIGDVLDENPRAILLVNQTGKIVFANRAASQLTALHDGLIVDRGELWAARTADTARLRAMIADATRTSRSEGFGSGGMLTLGRPSGRRPFVLVVSPMSRRQSDNSASTCATAVVVVHDPERFAIPDEGLLRTLFQLTPAEATLTRLLAAGGTLAEATQQLGLRPQTTRTRLKAIFEKTNTHRQADLVRLVLTGTPRP